jgi:hypothetical protein
MPPSFAADLGAVFAFTTAASTPNIGRPVEPGFVAIAPGSGSS